MRKTISLAVIFCLLMILSSCTPRYIFVPVPSPEDDTTPYDVETPEMFSAMLSATGQVRLTEDVTIPEISFESGKTYDIDLNGNVLTLTTDANNKRFVVEDSSIVNISNGTLSVNVPSSSNADGFVNVGENAKLVLDGVEYTSERTGIAISEKGAVLEVRNSVITAENGFAIGTNAGVDPADIAITIDNSEIYARNNTGVLFNISGTLNIINGSLIEAAAHGVIVRCGNLNIENSTIHSTCLDNPPAYDGFKNGNWGTGNNIQFGALIIGNASIGAGYNHDTIVNIDDNSKIIIDDTAYPAVYAATANGFTTNIQTIPDEYADMLKNPDNYFISTSTTGSIVVEGETIITR